MFYINDIFIYGSILFELMNLSQKLARAKLIKKHFKISYLKIASTYLFKKDKTVNLTLNNYAQLSIDLFQLFILAKLLENGWHILSGNKEYLTLKGPDEIVLTVRTKKGWDLGHLVEIFIDKVYGSDFYDKNVIDVGMSNGDSSIYFAKNGAKKVIGIEPDKVSFNLAVNNIKASKVDDRVIALNKALTAEAKEVELIIYEEYPNANSIDEKNMVKLEGNKRKVIVEGVQLKDIVDLFEGEPIGLLKMDCEGCEYAVLNSLDNDTYKKIEKIYMEYHNGLQNLPEILNKNGYTLEITNPAGSQGYIRAKRV